MIDYFLIHTTRGASQTVQRRLLSFGDEIVKLTTLRTRYTMRQVIAFGRISDKSVESCFNKLVYTYFYGTLYVYRIHQTISIEIRYLRKKQRCFYTFEVISRSRVISSSSSFAQQFVRFQRKLNKFVAREFVKFCMFFVTRNGLERN